MPALTRFTWPLPSGIGLGSAPVISPDGRNIAFVGRSQTASLLYVHGLGEVEAVPIPGTDEATHPFWSPDSASLGFFAKGQLMKVTLKGGAPVRLADALFPFGGTSNASGAIVFAPDVIMSGLFRVSANGHGAEPATVLEPSLGDTSHCWPAFLPDGVHFLYFVRSAQDERRGLYLGRIDRPAAPAGRPLLRSDSNAVYVTVPGTSQGLLLYVVKDRIEARSFDTKKLVLTGDARTLGPTAAATTLSQSGNAECLDRCARICDLDSAVRPSPSARGRRSTRPTAAGLGLGGAELAKCVARRSISGTRASRRSAQHARYLGGRSRARFERTCYHSCGTGLTSRVVPGWPFSGYVTGNLPFRPGQRVLHIAAADGTGVINSLPCPGEYCEPTDWTPRGLLVNVLARQRLDVWLVPTEGSAAAHPLLPEALDKREARMSRDGRWIAYVSSESGRPEVSVRSVSGTPKRFPVSSNGGDQPVWRRDNAELFFIDPRGTTAECERAVEPRRVSDVWTSRGDEERSFDRPRPLGHSVRRVA